MNMVKSHSAKVCILKDVQILVVDNHIDTRSLYSALLENLGANVTTAGSIKEALNLLDSLLPDILITEMTFQGETSDLLIQKLKYIALANDISIPILVTSTCSTSSIAQYPKLDVKAYLQKPIDIDHLVCKIWSLIQQAKITHPPRIQDWIKKEKISKKPSNRTIADQSHQISQLVQ